MFDQQPLRRIFLLASLLLASVCQSGAAGTAEVRLLGASDTAFDVAQPQHLGGLWRGRWTSLTTGHKGPMNAQFCPIDPLTYRVDFSGRFFGLIPFRYTATLHVTGYDGDRVLLAGSHYLGRLFGTFHFTGWADECHFVANYFSKQDRGQFVMTRSGR